MILQYVRFYSVEHVLMRPVCWGSRQFIFTMAVYVSPFFTVASMEDKYILFNELRLYS